MIVRYDEWYMNLFGRLINFKLVILVLLMGGWIYTSGRPIEKPQSQSMGRNLPEFEAIHSPYAVFFTEAIIPNKSNTVVQFPYYFATPHQPLFLTLPTNPEADDVIILVDHPIIEIVKTWPKISSRNLVLYQSNPVYETIDQFLGNVPSSDVVVADSALVFGQVIAPESNVIPLNDWNSEAPFEFFLTTYHEPTDKGHYNLFETRIDASEALLRECPNEEPNCQPTLMWKLDMPDTDLENTLYIGEIHVDFRQSHQ